MLAWQHKRHARGIARAAGRAAAQGGFTLIELMVVIAIIATLAAIVGLNLVQNIDEGNVSAAKAQIRNFKNGLIAYKLKFKKFPQSLEELASSGVLESSKLPTDPWGNQYVYTPDGSKYTIVSYGADGRAGGTEYDADISSDNLEGN